MVFGDALAKEDIPWAQVSTDGRYLLVTVYVLSGDVARTELYLQDRHNPEKGFVSVIKDIDAQFWGEVYQNTIYVMTNHEAQQWKIMAVQVGEVGKGIECWNTLIAEGRHRIQKFTVLRDRLFVETLENVCSALRMYDLNGRWVSDIALPTMGSIDAIKGEKEGDELFFRFSSFLVPHTVYRIDLNGNQCTVYKQVDAGINADMFTVKQVWYNSKDGTKVPMFLVHRKDLEISGNNPTLLFGYGGFNASYTPNFHFSSFLVPFLAKGGLFALANIRGGGEFGEEWHKAGMRENKQNVFDDFIAAAEWLIKNRYTNSQRLAIFGWSNGGLLMGAMLTQRPELFKAVVIGAPVLDMLKYHKFLNGRIWIPEFGSPDDPEQFRYLMAYSPYHNVKDETDYPAVLIVMPDRDDRVHPMHAYKMTARLQEANTSPNPILLRVEPKAGHSGAAPIYRVVEQYADIWSFLFWQLEMVK